MTIQSLGFTKPNPASSLRALKLRQALAQRIGFIWPAVASSLLLTSCAAELEDPEAYTARVRIGAGASGVGARQGVKPDETKPDDVSPQPTVSPQQTTEDSDETSSSAAPSTVSPNSSVAPSSNVSPGSELSEECEDVPTRIFQTKCDGASCHGTPGMPAQFFSNIASSTDPMILLDVPAKPPCQDKMLIDSENPADSAILSAIQADGHCSGGQMPSGGPYLSTDEVRCLTEWINAAASGAI